MAPLFCGFLKFFGQFRGKLFSLVIQSLQLSGPMSGQRISRDQRYCNGRITITDNAARKLGRIDLAPTDRFTRSSSGESPGIGSGVRDLEKVIMSLLGDTQY